MTKKSSEFWDELGDSISRKAKVLGEKAETFYEQQKLRSRISSEERSIKKLKSDLGNIIYQYYIDGQSVSEEQRILCEQIEQHENCIDRYKKKMSNIKKKKICPSCKEVIDMEVSFCPYCGVACPEEESDDVLAEEQVVSEAEVSGEEVSEAEVSGEEVSEAEVLEKEPSEEAPMAEDACETEEKDENGPSL